MRSHGAPTEAGRPASRRLLARLTDERLVALIRRGNESAFEELFDRHSRGVLSFCSRVLSSRQEGEDAHQHAFLTVYQAIGERNLEPRAFKPWLYTVARNHCFSVLRSRREVGFAGDDETVAAVGETAELAERQAEVRELLTDIRALPEPQRVALLLSELGDLSHTEIAQVIACPPAKVKSLLFQARASLCLSRDARETSCSRVREELAGSPRSRLAVALRRHLKRCEGCSEFARELRRRQHLISIALPVAPSIGLKRSLLAAAGGGGAGSGGGLAAGLVANGGSASVAPAALAGGPLSAGLGLKAGLVVATAAGVTAVSLVGAGVMRAPPHEQDSRPETPASGARSGATERPTPLGDTVVASRDYRARAADRRPLPIRPSEASPRPAQRAPTALSQAAARHRGSLALLQERHAPAPRLEVDEQAPDLDVGAPILDLVAGLLPDLPLGKPVPDLGVTPPRPDVGVTPPLPDLGVTPPTPGLGAPPPLPDPGVTPPLPDPGAPPPLP